MVRRPRRESNHTPRSNAEVKNEWSGNSAPHTPSWAGHEKGFVYIVSIRNGGNKCLKSDKQTNKQKVTKLAVSVCPQQAL